MKSIRAYTGEKGRPFDIELNGVIGNLIKLLIRWKIWNR